MRRAVPCALFTVLALALTACGGSKPRRSSPHPTRSATPAGGELAERWRWAAPPPSYVGMPAADGEGVAVTYGHSHVTLLDRRGRPLWMVDHRRLRDVPPRLTADAVLVPTEEGLLALDRGTGAERWETTIDERANTPVVAGGRAVVTTWDESLVGFDLATGQVAWRTALPDLAIGPATGDDHIVVATWGAGAVAVDPVDGRQRWLVPLPAGGVSGPGLAGPADDRLVVVVAGDIAAHALALETGAERWSTPLQGAGSPEVVPLDVGGGAVLVAHRLGGLVILDTGNGNLQWEVSSDGAVLRGGPAGPGPGGSYALPLEDGRLLVAGPGQPTRILDPPGRVSGVAAGPGGELLVGIREAAENELTALSGW